MTGTGEQVLFWVLGPLAVLGSLGLVFAKKAVHAALGMALTMIILGIFYIAQGADFLGVIQIFVYTGAVMMLFLFVIMLVGVDSSDSLVETLPGQRWVTAVLCLGFGGILAAALFVGFTLMDSGQYQSMIIWDVNHPPAAPIGPPPLP